VRVDESTLKVSRLEEAVKILSAHMIGNDSVSRAFIKDLPVVPVGEVKAMP